METSWEVKVVIIIALVATLTGFAISWVVDSRTRRLIAWLKETFPDEWAALPAFQQRWLRGAAIEALRHGTLKDNHAFAERYGEISRLRRRMITAVAVGGAAIGVVLIGTKFGGWQW